MNTTETRNQAVAQTMAAVKASLRAGLDRAALRRVQQQLVALAGQPGLWSSEHFAAPAPDTLQARYLITEDADQSYALYLNVMRPGKRILPHNHTTWACIAAVEGQEINRLYEREGGGHAVGPATLRQVRQVTVEPGSGIALMPDDIHSVEIPAGQVIRHLHLYGRALETLSERVCYDLEAGTCRLMDIGARTVRQ